MSLVIVISGLLPLVLVVVVVVVVVVGGVVFCLLLLPFVCCCYCLFVHCCHSGHCCRLRGSKGLRMYRITLKTTVDGNV